MQQQLSGRGSRGQAGQELTQEAQHREPRCAENGERLRNEPRALGDFKSGSTLGISWKVQWDYNVYLVVDIS